MKFKSFSGTQLKALSWWSDSSPYRDYDAVICDGAVRSGKTMCMGISFVCWAMHGYACSCELEWEAINLQDQVEEAKAALYNAQAEKIYLEEGKSNEDH